jgi:hypothetical protein
MRERSSEVAMNESGRSGWTLPARVLSMALVIIGTVGVSAGTEASPSTAPGALYDAILPDLRAAVATSTAGELSTYEIDVRLDVAASTLVGRERVSYVNTTDTPLDEVYFRLFPNAAYYDEGGVVISKLRVGGRAIASPELVVEETALRVPLPATLAAGDEIEIALDFAATVPGNSSGSYGIFNRDDASGTWVLSDWYPIVAGYEADQGWSLDRPTAFGDPTFAEAALYDVSLTTPADLVVVASGSAIEETTEGEATRRRIVTGPARDFALVVDADFVAVSAEAGGTTVTAYAPSDAITGAEATLAYAKQVLAAYSARLGAYPYAELDLVATPLAGALGVAWTGILFIAGDRLYPNHDPTAGPGTPLEFTVAHEVGHQWWGVNVGSDTNDHAFMVEGLTNYLSAVALDWLHGAEVGDEAFDRYVVRPFAGLVRAGEDGVANLPTTEDEDARQRSAIIYGKAAFGFHAIREEIGDDAFFTGLRVYAEANAFLVTAPADLRAAWETASGQDLDALWTHWFEEAEATLDEIEALAP